VVGLPRRDSKTLRGLPHLEAAPWGILMPHLEGSCWGGGVSSMLEEAAEAAAAAAAAAAALRLLLQQEQETSQALRLELKSLKSRVTELNSWAANPDVFMSDVAAAIQLARDAHDNEVRALRGEVKVLRTSHEATSTSESEGERKRLQAEVTRLEALLKMSQSDLDKSKKELFAERVRAKRSARDHEQSRAQLRSAREEMTVRDCRIQPAQLPRAARCGRRRTAPAFLASAPAATRLRAALLSPPETSL
jgi:hypothetical protein